MANDVLVVVTVVVKPFIAQLLSSRIVLYCIVLFSFISYWIISYEFDCAVLLSWFLKVSQGAVIVRNVSYFEAPGINLCSFADDVLLPLPLKGFAAAGQNGYLKI